MNFKEQILNTWKKIFLVDICRGSDSNSNFDFNWNTNYNEFSDDEEIEYVDVKHTQIKGKNTVIFCSTLPNVVSHNDKEDNSVIFKALVDEFFNNHHKESIQSMLFVNIAARLDTSRRYNEPPHWISTLENDFKI